MDPDQLLFAFSIIFIITMLGLVFVPYIARKSELLLCRNLFLLGSVVFVGLSGINSAYNGHYFYYDGSIFARFFAAIVVFYTSFLVFYSKLRFAERIAHRSLKKWPIPNRSSLFILLILMLLAIPLLHAGVRIPGLSAIARLLGFIGPSFAVVFAFFIWKESKGNLVTWLILGLTATIVIFALLASGGGRRGLYAALFAVPFCVYWNYLRRAKPAVVTLLVFLSVVPAVILDAAYYHVRWEGRTRFSTIEVDSAIDRMELIFNRLGDLKLFSLKRIAEMGQTGVEYSLVSILVHTTEKEVFPIQPFHSVYTLLTAPVPREYWDDKPDHLGNTLPFDVGTIPRGTNTNIGPGIAGHCYHEGGLHMAVFYGFLVGFALRYLDTILLRRCLDPIFMGFVVASAFHIAGWSRGAIFSFTLSPLFAFAIMIVIYTVLRVTGLGVRQDFRPGFRTRRNFPLPNRNNGRTLSVDYQGSEKNGRN